MNVIQNVRVPKKMFSENQNSANLGDWTTAWNTILLKRNRTIKLGKQITHIIIF